MPEVSNCEIYKLESKLEGLETIIERLKAQMNDWKYLKIVSGDPRLGMSLDDDQLSAVSQNLERSP